MYDSYNHGANCIIVLMKCTQPHLLALSQNFYKNLLF